MFDDVVLVLFGVDVNLFLALLVLKAKFVEVGGLAAFGAARFNAALGLVGGQGVGRHLAVVVDAAGDERLVGVAFEEVDDDFLADARQGHHAPVLARPGLRHAHPAGGVFVALAVAVPVELNLHPPVLVGVNLFARRAGDDGGLRALDGGLWGQAGRAVGLGGFDGGERALEQVAFGDRVGGGDVSRWSYVF